MANRDLSSIDIKKVENGWIVRVYDPSVSHEYIACDSSEVIAIVTEQIEGDDGCDPYSEESQARGEAIMNDVD